MYNGDADANVDADVARVPALSAELQDKSVLALVSEERELPRECEEKRLEAERVDTADVGSGSGDADGAAAAVFFVNGEGRTTRMVGRGGCGYRCGCGIAGNWLPPGVDGAEEQTASRIILNNSSSSSSSSMMAGVWTAISICRVSAA